MAGKGTAPQGRVLAAPGGGEMAAVRREASGGRYKTGPLPTPGAPGRVSG